MTKLDFIGQDELFDFGENAKYQLHFENEDELTVTVVEDANYAAGTVKHYTPQITHLQDTLYLITWVEEDTGNTVTHIDDFVRGISYTNITDLASKSFWRLKGLITK